MPTHIDVLCGHYRDVVASKRAGDRGRPEVPRARRAAELLLALPLPRLTTSSSTARCSSASSGRRSRRPTRWSPTLPEELLQVEVPPMADWLEGFVPMKMHVLIRFGRWQEIIDEPLPRESGALLCHHRDDALREGRRARGDRRRRRRPSEQRELFSEPLRACRPRDTCSTTRCLDILAIAAEMLDGEVEYRKGNLRRRLRPPAPVGRARRQPALRRALGLDAADAPRARRAPARAGPSSRTAEAVYRADLGLDGTLARACQHPDNVWSLHGLHECLTRLGKTTEAAMLQARLDVAVARADVPIRSSCFCRLEQAA